MDHETVVEQGRRAFGATIEFGEKALRQPLWAPTAGSEAAAELANAEMGQNGPWAEDPPRTAYAAAHLMMTAVLDDLASLQQLLGAKMPVIGSTVIARSAVEIASTVWWLMEPGIGVRKRVTRELVLSLTSARRAGQVAKGMREAAKGADPGEAVTDALGQEARVMQRISDLGLGQSIGGRRYEPVIDGEKAPDATSGTAESLKLVLPVKASKDSIYRTYSAVTHGEIYGLMNFMLPVVSPDGRTLLHWHLDPDVLDSTIQVAISTFGATYRRIQRVMGWGKLEGDLWELKVQKIFNGA